MDNLVKYNIKRCTLKILRFYSLNDTGISLLSVDEGVSTFASGSTSGKYLYVNHSISKVSTNKYTMTITLSTSSSYVYNGYGVRVYAVIAGTKRLLGVPTVTNGIFSTSSYSYTFTISANTACYAFIQCAWCEDGLHNEYYEQFYNKTTTETLTFEQTVYPPTAPTSVVLSGRYEQDVNLTCSWSGSTNATNHDIQYRYWDFIGNTYTAWTALEWANSSSSRILYGLVMHSGVQTRVRANGAGGTSAWKESNILYHQGVRVYDGANWVFGTIKIWNGSAWNNLGGMYVYDGSSYQISK